MGRLTFQVEFLLQCEKCHIIQADTSIKDRRSLQTVDSKGIITSLHHPQTIWFSLYLPFCVVFFYTDMSECSKTCNLMFLSFMSLNLTGSKTQPRRCENTEKHLFSSIFQWICWMLKFICKKKKIHIYSKTHLITPKD